MRLVYSFPTTEKQTDNMVQKEKKFEYAICSHNFRTEVLKFDK